MLGRNRANIMLMQRLKLTIILVSSLGSGAIFAQACTYDEAIMALKQGNQTRGFALLRMAARDGDQRATHKLAQIANDTFVKAQIGSEQFENDSAVKINSTAIKHVSSASAQKAR